MDIISAIIGLSGGFLGGLLGVGGGILYVALLMLLKGVDVHRAVGTSLLVIVFTGAFGAFFHHREGMVDVKIAIVMGIFSILGVWLGTKVSVSMDAALLKRVFAVFLVIMAFKIFFTK